MDDATSLDTIATRTRFQSSLHPNQDNEQMFTITLRSSLRGLHGLLISIPRWSRMQTINDDESQPTYEESELTYDDSDQTYEESTSGSEVGSDTNSVNLDKIDLIVLNKNTRPSDDCPICLEPFKLRQHCRRFKCNHIFHKKCADRWILRKPQCPVCRQAVQPLQPLPLQHQRVLRQRRPVSTR